MKFVKLVSLSFCSHYLLILIFFFEKKGLAATGATDVGFYGQGIITHFLFFH